MDKADVTRLLGMFPEPGDSMLPRDPVTDPPITNDCLAPFSQMSDAQVLQVLQLAGIQLQPASGQLLPEGIPATAPTAELYTGTHGDRHAIDQLEELASRAGKTEVAKLAKRVTQLVGLENALYGRVRPETSRLATGQVPLSHSSAYIKGALSELQALVPDKWALYQTNPKEWVQYILRQPQHHLRHGRRDTSPVSQYYQLCELLHCIAKDPAFLIIEHSRQKAAAQAHFYNQVREDWLRSTAPETYASQVTPLVYRANLDSTYRRLIGDDRPGSSWEKYTRVAWRVLGAGTTRSDLPVQIPPQCTGPLHPDEKKEPSLLAMARRFWREGKTTLADRQLLQAADEKLQSLFSEPQNPSLLQEPLRVILHGLHEFLGRRVHRYQQRSLYYQSLETHFLPTLHHFEHWTPEVIGRFLTDIEYQTRRGRKRVAEERSGERSVPNRRVHRRFHGRFRGRGSTRSGR